MNKLLIKTLILSGVLLGVGVSVNAEVIQSPLTLRTEANVINTNLATKNKFIKTRLASAENRFLQGNVNASREDFSHLISQIAHDDYVFLSYAIKLAEYGLFDLSEELISKLDRNLFTENYINDIRKYYYPSSKVSAEDAIFLSDAYASIVYNNLAIETTSELQNSNQTVVNDYKNYLIALGFYKSNNLSQALKYINNAITQNDININYKVLKTKILADSNKSKQALKMLEEINNIPFETVDFQEKIKAVNEYVQYKVAKDEPLKDYHLSYYYHLQDKSLLATKVLQSAILQAKQYSSRIFGLLGRIYYENNEPLKAQEFALRSFKEDSKNYLANLTLADLAYDEKKYNEALEYYKQAKKSNKKEVAPSVGLAKTYLVLNKDKKSKKLYEKLLKLHSNDEDLLVSSLKVFPQRADDYLPRVASVDITNTEIWLGMANLAIQDENYSMAETYLNNSYYIDENNFKYYYYLSLVLKAKGDMEKSQQSLIKCKNLNSNYNLEEIAGR